jgi:hypothetical protein
VRLSQHIVKNRTQELKGARVLDLGSGTGEHAGSTAQACFACAGCTASSLARKFELCVPPGKHTSNVRRILWRHRMLSLLTRAS